MKTITTTELRQMEGKEGLILQGCGGDLQEWVDGINGLLQEDKILPEGERLDNVMTFQHEGLTNLLFLFGEEHLDMSKLAIWRLQSYEQFGGTWLSDYVPNRLGDFLSKEQGHQETQEKPECPLIGADGNIFNLLGIASRTLKVHGQEENAKEMVERVTGGSCHSYEEALMIIADYVTITSQEGEEEGMGMRLE